MSWISGESFGEEELEHWLEDPDEPQEAPDKPPEATVDK